MINVEIAMPLLLFFYWDLVKIQTQWRFNLYLRADTGPLRRGSRPSVQQLLRNYMIHSVLLYFGSYILEVLVLVRALVC